MPKMESWAWDQRQVKGNEDENLCNATGLPTSLITGASYFDTHSVWDDSKRFARHNDSWFITSK